MRNGPTEWELVGREEVYTGRVFSLSNRTSRHPERGVHDFQVIESRDWVNVVAMTPDREIVLIRQYRHGTREVTLEIPGGMVDPGETPETAAARELREETGYVGSPAERIGWVHPNPAIQDNRCHTYLIENAERVEDVAFDATEEIEVVLAPEDSIESLARSGRITHGLVIDAFYWLAMREEKLR